MNNIQTRHHKINSSNLESVGYDPDNLLLEVTFKNGTTYSYYPITERDYARLMAAPSTGKHFNSEIKNLSRLEVQKIEPAPAPESVEGA